MPPALIDIAEASPPLLLVLLVNRTLVRSARPPPPTRMAALALLFLRVTLVALRRPFTSIAARSTLLIPRMVTLFRLRVAPLAILKASAVSSA